jgi:hypothetical protein
MKLLIWALLFPAWLAAQGAALTISGPTVARNGAAVTLTLALVTGGGPAGLQWDMTGLPTGATVTSSVTTKVATCTAPPTRCILIGSSPTALNATAIPDGTVATIQYTQTATAATTAIVATLGATPAGAALAVTQPAAAITVPIQSNCDLNADGLVNSVDVGLAIQQALVTPTTITVVAIIQEIIAANGGACLR